MRVRMIIIFPSVPSSKATFGLKEFLSLLVIPVFCCFDQVLFFYY